MQKFRNKMMLFILCITVLFPGLKVSAQETTAITLKLESQTGKKVNISCNMLSGDAVTSGKIRVKYDGSKLKLNESRKGSLLENDSAEINDPVSGNKPEGEIVMAFASAKGLAADGTLLHMDFTLGETVKEGDTFDIEATVEELYNDHGGMEVTNKKLTLKAEANNKVTTKDPASAGKKKNSKSKSNGAKTGDHTNIVVPAALLGGSAILMVVLIRKMYLK